MKEFNIKITDTDVYINSELCECAYPMDKENKEDDLNKRAILALADKMGYESVFLFEEMVDRLDEMLDEIDEEEDVDGDFLQSLADDAADEEMVAYWTEQLLESVGKSNVNELTTEEITAEIEEMRGTMQNEEILLGVTEFAEENIRQMVKYVEVLQELLKTAK